MKLNALERIPKKVLLLALALTLLLSGYFLRSLWIESNQSNSNTENDSSNVIDTELSRTHAELSTNKRLVNQNEDKVSADVVPENIDAEVQILSNWMQDNGFEVQITESLELELFHNSTYHVMETQELVRLAETDQVAELVLGSRLFQEGAYERAAPILELSVLRGYAKPILSLSEMFANKAQAAAKAKRKEETHELVLNHYMWQEVYSQRFFEGELEYYNDWVFETHDYTLLEIKEMAKKRGVEKYQELQDLRTELGYPEFSNDMPDAFRKMVGRD